MEKEDQEDQKRESGHISSQNNRKYGMNVNEASIVRTSVWPSVLSSIHAEKRRGG